MTRIPLTFVALVLLLILANCDRRHEPAKTASAAPVDITTSQGPHLTLLQPEFSTNFGRAKAALVCFSAADFEVLVLDNGSRRNAPRYRNLADAMEQQHCVLGTNGGFFDLANFRPNGLMISDGQGIGALDAGNWAGGILAVRGGRVLLLDQKGFQPDVTVTQALQTGPWLVRGGTAQTGFSNDTAPHARTFVATDGADLIVLGHIDACTLQELATFLGSGEFKQFLAVRDALNLDGGPSSGFWLQSGSATRLDLQPSTVVRNFLGVRPKAGPAVKR